MARDKWLIARGKPPAEPQFDDYDYPCSYFTLEYQLQELTCLLKKPLRELTRLLRKPLRDLISFLKDRIQITIGDTLAGPTTSLHIPRWDLVNFPRYFDHFPRYYESKAGARGCADQVAATFGFHFKEGNSYVDSSGTIKLIVDVFSDNWYKSENCYSFGSYIEFRKGNGNAMCIYPPRNWRKRPSFFAADVELMVSCVPVRVVSNEARTRKAIRRGVKILPAGVSR